MLEVDDLRSLRRDRVEVRVLSQKLEVLISVEHRRAGTDCDCCDQAIVERSDCPAGPPTISVERRRPFEVVEASSRDELTASEQPPQRSDVSVVAATREHLHDDDIGRSHRSIRLDEVSHSKVGRTVRRT